MDPTFFAHVVSEFWGINLVVDVDCHHNDRNHLEKKNQGQTHQSGRKYCVRYRDAHEVSPYLTFFFSNKLITFFLLFWLPITFSSLCNMWLKHIRVLFRSTHGGRNLWKSEDEIKWKHDKFEQMTLLEAHNKEVIILLKFRLHAEYCFSIS